MGGSRYREFHVAKVCSLQCFCWGLGGVVVGGVLLVFLYLDFSFLNYDRGSRSKASSK